MSDTPLTDEAVIELFDYHPGTITKVVPAEISERLERSLTAERQIASELRRDASLLANQLQSERQRTELAERDGTNAMISAGLQIAEAQERAEAAELLVAQQRERIFKLSAMLESRDAELLSLSKDRP